LPEDVVRPLPFPGARRAPRTALAVRRNPVVIGTAVTLWRLVSALDRRHAADACRRLEPAARADVPTRGAHVAGRLVDRLGNDARTPPTRHSAWRARSAGGGARTERGRPDAGGVCL